MKNLASSIGLALVLGGTATGSMGGQRADMTATARLVTVDVSVTDKNGHAIHGLTCADFKLEESHDPQTLQRCDESVFVVHGGADALPKGLPANVFSNGISASLPATLDICLIDFLNGGPETRGALKQAALDVIRTATPGHRMAVFVLGQRLALLSGFTDDQRRLELAQAGIPAGVVNLGATRQSQELSTGVFPSAIQQAVPVSAASQALIDALAGRVMEDRVDATLSALREIDTYVAGLPGRKKLLWITSSFPNLFQPHPEDPGPALPPPGTLMDIQNFQPRIEEVSRELARDRIAIFPIDVRGVRNTSLMDASQDSMGIATQSDLVQTRAAAARFSEINEQATMNTLAAETGGHAFYGDNDVDHMVRKALETGRDFYTLSYRPSNLAADGRFRSFRITTVAAGAKLVYRRGYIAPGKSATGASSGVPTGIGEGSYAMKRGLPVSTAIQFFAGLHKDGAPRPIVQGDRKSKGNEQQYRIDYSINPANLVWTEVGAEHMTEVTLLLAAYDSAGGTLGHASHPVRLKMDEAKYAEVLRNGLRLQERILLPAGKEAFLRLGVLDQGSEREGTLEIPLSALGPEPQPSPGK